MKQISLSIVSALIILGISSVAGAQTVDRNALENEIRGLVTQLKEAEQEFLAPSAKDQAKHSAFLSQPDTGLIRLLPRKTFETRISIEGGGAYYSFARMTHEYGFGSDIELELGQLSVGFAGADFGFLTRIGKIAVEGVTVDHPAAQFLATFVAPSAEGDARDQYRRGAAGFDVNGIKYSSHIKLKKKNTYFLRSIVYDRSDLLVAFQVVRIDSDGSAVLLWKILKRFEVPRLVH
jgi:hypothetical protein